jgi:PiT family inorganic phosphate transporter
MAVASALGFALLTGLGFEFVNGFHDTANAAFARAACRRGLVGHLEFIGVLVSSGAVAFGIIRSFRLT